MQAPGPRSVVRYGTSEHVRGAAGGRLSPAGVISSCRRLEYLGRVEGKDTLRRSL